MPTDRHASRHQADRLRCWTSDGSTEAHLFDEHSAWSLSSPESALYGSAMGETAREGVEATQSEPNRRQISQSHRTAMFRLAYEESQRALSDQLLQLDAMRQRTTQILAFIGTATAFLVGTGVTAPSRDLVFYVIAWAGTAATFATLTVGVAVLLGFRSWSSEPHLYHWNSRLSACDLLKWIDADVPPRDEAAFLGAVAKENDASANENERNLHAVRKWYVCFVFLAFAQLLIWTGLVWARG